MTGLKQSPRSSRLFIVMYSLRGKKERLSGEILMHNLSLPLLLLLLLGSGQQNRRRPLNSAWDRRTNGAEKENTFALSISLCLYLFLSLSLSLSFKPITINTTATDRRTLLSFRNFSPPRLDPRIFYSEIGQKHSQQKMTELIQSPS